MSVYRLSPREAIAAAQNKKEKKYWLEKLSGDWEKSVFPFGKGVCLSTGDEITFAFSPGLSEKLIKLSNGSDYQLYMVLVTGLTALMYRYGGKTDIILGAPIYRQKTEGDFINTLLVLRNRFEPRTTFKELLLHVRDTLFAAVEHQNYPVKALINELDIRDTGEEFPLFDMMVLLDNIQDENYVKHIKTNTGISFSREDNHMKGVIKYNPLRYRYSDMETILPHLTRLLEDALGDIDKQLPELEILSQQEKRQLLLDFNETEGAYPDDQTIHSWFAAQAAKTPNNIAVVGVDRDAGTRNSQVSYRELDQKANRLANVLLAKGIGPDTILPIMAERSLEMIIGVLGIFKAGGAYLPVDPHYPEGRKAYMLKASGAGLLLTAGITGAPDFIPQGMEIIDLDEKSAYSGSEEAPEYLSDPSHLGYVIFTSGSTGKPKGVMVEHKNLVNLTYFNFHHTAIDCGKILQFSTLSFDASFNEIFCALLSGGQLILVADETRTDIPGLLALVARHKIVTLFLPMSLLRIIFSDEEHISQFPSCVRHIQTAGEQVVVSRRFAAFLKENHIFLHNHYGPSETHVVTTLTMDPREEIPERPTIGKPILNTQAYILDREMNPLPVGVPGELYFSGFQVGRGYLDRPGLTHEKFVHFYRSNRSYRTYKTGDLAKWRPDGNIEFLGRIDHQVKIRGFRVEPGEVESRLVEHTAVKEAVVLVGEESSGNKYLCAYIVAEQPVEKARLQDHLAKTLPDYMIPSYFIQLEKIPLTPNGKVDRKALPSIDAAMASETYAPPRSDTEKTLCRIWSGVLELSEDTVGIDDNFFRLGGHSLRASVIISKIQKTFETKILLGDIFKHPTIRELAKYIENATGLSHQTIEPAIEKKYYVLSSAQKRLYIMQQLNPENMSYNMPMTAILEGELDKDRLKKAFLGLIRRHESLRTSFHMVDEQPVQMVHDTVEFSVECTSLEPGAEGLEGFIQPFDLAQAPLMRVGLLKMEESSYILVADMHHIITDDASMGILAREFMALYAGETLPELELRYRDYSQWQQSGKIQKFLKQQESYWLNKFSGGVPVLNLPTDYPRPVVHKFSGDFLEFEIGKSEKEALKSYALKEDATLYMVLLATFNILLAKLCSQEEIVTGSIISTRRHASLEPVMGMFVNTLVSLNHPGADKPVNQFLKEIRISTLESLENRDYPFEELVERVDTRRDTGRNPLFDVAFTMRSADMAAIRIPGLRLTPYPYKGNTTKFDLAVIAKENDNELSVAIEYSTALFKKETIERFVTYFKKLLRDIPALTAHTISSIDIIPEEEKKQILFDFNDTAADYPREKPIHLFFEEQAERTGGQLAVSSGQWQLTYGELDQRANRLAHVLQEKGVAPESIVAIKMERSIEMVIGILGILKAGGAYLPIDPGYPRERMDYMLKDSNANLLLTSDDITSARPATRNPQPATRKISSTDLAYIIYTSGSTGKPKGVPVEHGSVVNLLTALEKMYPITDSGCYLLKTSFNFDVSVTELFGWFLCGGRLAILEPGEEKDPAVILAAVARNRITHINFVPSMFSVFLEQLTPGNIREINRLNYIFLAGEALPAELVTRFRELNVPVRLENLYGPTEGTVYASGYSLSRWRGGAAVPIGTPLANVKLFILDQTGCVQPVGVAGELCIAGTGVARGYLNRPELTAERFIDFHRSNMSYRTYKTGDLTRWLPSGDIQYLGRIDHQVKIRGFRVEPGEIENRLAEHTGIKEAVVMAREDSGGDKYLCAYITAEQPIETTQLVDYLAQSLPEYMIPSYFVQLDGIPLTPNGKINRAALPRPDSVKSKAFYVAPSTAVEKKLCRLWAGVLGSPAAALGIDDNFFVLGGHSLKAAVLASKIQKAFNVRIILGEIFDHPTIRRLSQHIENAVGHVHAAINTAEEKEYYILSSAQKRLYILQHMEPGTTGYNMPAVFQLKGKIDIDRLKKTFRELAGRHESLRTSFLMVDEIPVQRVQTAIDLPVEKIGPMGPIGPIKNIIADFIRPFDLTRAPLLRVGLVDIKESSTLLMVDMHHIISDGVSMNILIKEFMQLYRGEAPPLPGLRYRDYAEWQQERIMSGIARQQEAYWLKRYADGVPLLNLPIDHPRPPVQSFAGNRLEFQLGNHHKELLNSCALTEDATLFMMLLAVFNILLAKLCSQEEIAVGTMVAARKHADLEPVMGMFVNTLVFTNHPKGDISVSRFLQNVRNVTLEAFEHQEYPFEDLVEKLSVTRDPSRNPLFDAAITMQREDTGTTGIHGLQLTPYPFKNNTAKFDIAVIATETTDGLTFAIEYCTALFEEQTIHRFITYYKKLLEEIPDQAAKKISQIEILPEEEKKRLLVEINDPGNRNASYPADKTIHQLFREQVSRTPDRIAAAGPGDGWHISYRQLDQEAGNVARLLREKGIGPGDIVGIMIQPSSRMPASMLGILNAGAAYLPLDPEYPGSRITFMLEDCRVPLLLTESCAIKEHSFTFLQGLRKKGSPAPVHKAAPRAQITDLHRLPKPCRSLVNYEKYNRHIGQAMVAHCISIQATRGCPYGCEYCHKIWPKKHVVRSAEDIFREVTLYYNMGVRRFAFIDDIFNLDIENSSDFFRRIIDAKYELQLFFPNGMRGDILTREYIDLMVQAGTVNVALALETASPRLQKLIKKNLDLEKLRANIEYFCQKHPQVILELFTMHGFPTESENEARMTLDFLKSLKWVHFPYFHVLKIYPNTGMARLAIEQGISEDAVAASAQLAYHRLPETLPFEKSVTLKLQAEFLNDYFLSKERLLHVLPLQMKVLTEKEIVRKYDSYLPVDIKSFGHLLEFTGIRPEELGSHRCREELSVTAPGLNEKLKNHFGQPEPDEDATRVLLLDTSQYFSSHGDMLYDVVEPPLGLMYLAGYLLKEMGGKVHLKIAKSRIDFDSYAELRVLLQDFQPDVIGIRTLTFYSDFFHQTAALIRQWGIIAPIVAGGPYATSDYETVLQDKNIDLVVTGEGEVTFAELIAKIRKNNGQLPSADTLHNIPGIAVAHRKNSRDILLLDQQETTGKTGIAEPAVQPSNPAYVIYTSGSTGKPKGVMISHNNVVRLMKNRRFLFDFGPEDVWTLFHSYCFDFSVWEMYGALLYGGKLLITPRMTAKDPQRFLSLLETRSVTILNQTPPAFYHLIAEEFRFWEHKLHLKYIIFGGDALHPAKLEKWHSVFPHTRLINMFGITETTVHVTYKEIGKQEIRTGISNIGRPIPTLSTYVMDKNLSLSPTGVPGELFVGGEGVGIGYLNRPELSAEKFITNPYIPGERLYRSGDLVKLRDNGDMVYLGRIDHQVQVRGYRVEPGEIGKRLAAHPQIRDAVVLSYSREDGDIELCAYFTLLGEPVETGLLREHLAIELPDYMIPAHFIRLKEFPLTRNGKIDHKRLPSPTGAPLPGSPGTLEALQSPVEKKLAKIWSGVLAIDESAIHRDAHFFELGGHSLKATIMAARVHSELDVKIPLAEIFTMPTIRGLAQFIADARKQKQSTVEPAEKKEYYPLSPAQKRLYISQHMNWENSGYNMQTVVTLEGELHPEKIEGIFRKLIGRHESFRTSFHMVDEQPVQMVHESVAFSIEEIGPIGPIGPIKDIIAGFIRPFDLARAPLMRVGLVKLREDRHILMVDMHHIITDGTSMAILTNEFMALFGGKTLSALELDYKDFSEWKQRLLRDPEEKERLADQEAYWLERFKDEVPPLDLPLDYPRPEVQSFAGDAVSFRLDAEQTAALKSLAAQEDVTLYMIFLAVLNVLLAKIGDVEDVVIGTPVAGRNHTQLEPLIGFFINMLAIRNRPEPAKTFGTLLQEVKTNALNAFDNQDYPFEDLVDKLSITRDSRGHSLFDVVLVLQNIDSLTGFSGEIETGGLRITHAGNEIMQMPFDLALWGFETGETMEFNLGYKVTLFKRATVEQMIKNIDEIFLEVLQDRDVPLEDIAVSHQFLEAAPDSLPEDEGDFGF